MSHRIYSGFDLAEHGLLQPNPDTSERILAMGDFLYCRSVALVLFSVLDMLSLHEYITVSYQKRANGSPCGVPPSFSPRDVSNVSVGVVEI